MKQILFIVTLIITCLSAANAQTLPKSAAELPTNIKVANDQPGANLGAKINAADAACGKEVGCQIWVFDGGNRAANTISTQVVVGSNHTLRFFEGVFYCKFPSQSGVILLKDNSNLIHSSITNNVLRNLTWGQAIIRERGVSNNNRFVNNHARIHYHDTDSVITNSIYLNNYWAGAASDMGFFEAALSNNNIYQGNITAPKLLSSGNYGLTVVGKGSKVLSHSFTDGRTFITNINGTNVPFLNPN